MSLSAKRPGDSSMKTPRATRYDSTLCNASVSDFVAVARVVDVGVTPDAMCSAMCSVATTRMHHGVPRSLSVQRSIAGSALDGSTERYSLTSS